MSQLVTAAPARPTSRRAWHRAWPAVAAVALAALTAYDLTGAVTLAPILAASGLVYLGAAALGRPAAAWPLFGATFVVVTAAKFIPALPDATWLFLGLAGLFVAYGLWRGTGDLTVQSGAMVAFGAAAALALALNGTVGAYLVAAGLLGHAAWDVYHHRTNTVVRRSLAEFCFVLDTLLAVAVLVVAIRG